MAKIIDDVSRGCLMETRTRARAVSAREKEMESNSSEHASGGGMYYVIIRGAVGASSSCQFRNIVPITNVTLERLQFRLLE